MSAKKIFETKVFDDQESDYGIDSGPLSEQLLSSEEVDIAKDCPVKSKEQEQVNSDKGLDSGLCLTEPLSNINLNEYTPVAKEESLIVIEDERPQDIPPISILFQPDDDGDTQLHIAAVHGCQKSVGILIRVCPNKAWLDIPNDYGHTPLHLAAMSGNAVVARMLVRAGANLDVRDSTGENPLHKAVGVRNLECIQALLRPVSDALSPNFSKIVNQRNYKGQCCVHLAAQAGRADVLQLLVYFGADVNAREGLAGWTPLHIAARQGDATLIHSLQRSGAVLLRDYAGRTARSLVATRDARVLAMLPKDDDDSDDEPCPCTYDSDSETLFDKIRQSVNPINVA